MTPCEEVSHSQGEQVCPTPGMSSGEVGMIHSPHVHPNTPSTEILPPLRVPP